MQVGARFLEMTTDELPTETFGTALRRLRVHAGLSQERLAEFSGISAAGIAALEAGRRTTPRLNTVGLLCDALRVDPGQRAALITAATQPTSGQRGPGAPAATIRLDTEPLPRVDGRTAGDDLFVGRARELAALRSAWQAHTRMVLVAGEAGAGKTTLVRQWADELAADRATVLVGRSTPQQLGVFEAFVEPLRAALAGLPGDLPPALLDVGRLVPGLLDVGGDVLVPSRADPAVERRLLFEAVANLLGSLGPTLLILDDLHWADPGSLALLAYLAARQDLGVLTIAGTVRSTDLTTATGAALGELRRHCTVARVELAGLAHAELAELMAGLAGQQATATLIDTVSAATNGNPLFVRELTEHLLQRSEDESDAASAIPIGIRDTLQLRIARLSSESQALVRGGAVLGQSFDPQLAGQLVELTGEALLAAVEDALLSGLVVEQTARLVAFSHGLVAAAIYEATPQLRRLVLHERAAVQLAERNPTSTSAIVDVARHWSIVAVDDPAVRATASLWSVRAGDAASAAASVNEAIDWYRRAVSLWDDGAPESADALMRLGSALMTSGELGEGEAALGRALLAAEDSGNVEVFARAALGLAASVRYTHSDPQRIDELERAIAKFDPSEMVLRPALLATLRRQLGFVETEAADRRRNEAARLVAEAVSAPDVSEELLVSLGGLRDSLIVDDPIPLGQLAASIVRVAATRQDLPAMSTGWYRQAWSALELGNGELFRRSVSEYRSIAERLRRPYELAISANMLAAVAQIEGRYDDAEACGQEALAQASTIEDGNFAWVYFANSGLRAYDSGQAAATFELMTAARRDFAGLATFEAGYTAMAAAAGEIDLTRQLLDDQVGANGEVLDDRWVYLSAERLPVVGMLAWACSLAGFKTSAPVMRARLERIGELGVRAIRIAPVGAWIGPLDHHLGALNRLIGDLDSAEMHLRQALLVEDDMNGRPYQIRTMLELAAVAEERPGAAARAEAAAWRGEAEKLADTIGLQTIVPLDN
jgi:transcriptional regulator with XRE-family HTH domain/tetratricopeptide (TPR) repeat protein